MPCISRLCFLFILIFCASSSSASTTSALVPCYHLLFQKKQTTPSLTQHGITWKFAKPIVYGQFVNGDYWVLDNGAGVEIIEISPGHTILEGTVRHLNGSMLNPHDMPQGYDSYSNYDEAKNVGINITPQTPLLLLGNSSLVSTISNGLDAGVNHKSYVKRAAVLTCLDEIPPQGSFRPGISSSTKTLHRRSSINIGLLKNLTYPGTKPDIAGYADLLQMVWLAHNGGWSSRYMRPSDSGLDNYYYATPFAEASLLLHLDYSLEEKERLLINLIQLGIDLYSYPESGGSGWPPDGGHMSGRKWPILFAGIMLNYAPMKNIGQLSGDYLYNGSYGAGNAPPDYIHFGEDGQTFYVTQEDIDLTNGPTWDPDTRNAGHSPYSQAMLGMPEWGIRHSTQPNRSDSSWTATYRSIGTGPRAWAGTVLAAYIMDAKSLWNNDAFFDYVDRYVAISGGTADPFGYTVPDEQSGSGLSGIIATMWQSYRSQY